MVFFSILLLATTFLWASEPPCSEFEFFVKAHEVQAYSRKDGTPVSAAYKNEHCKEIFIGTRNWTESFQDQALVGWPYLEKFKKWSKSEKEIILKIISNWPNVFQNWNNASIHRAVRSSFKNNPAASLPGSNAIIIYDRFFKEKNLGAILAHELTHIYLLNLNPDGMKEVLRESGWIFDEPKPKWSGKIPPFMEDSLTNPSEDLANYIEVFLYAPNELKRTRSKIFNLLTDLIGKDFKLKDSK